MKLWITLALLGLVLIIPFAQADSMHTAGPVDATVLDRALVFLTDVVGLDETKYKITLTDSSDWNFDPRYPSVQDLRYNLTAEKSTMSTSFWFTNNTWFHFNMYSNSGVPLFVEPAKGSLEEAKALLHRYQTSLKRQYAEPMVYMLNSLNDTAPVKVIMGNITLKVTSNEYGLTFRWTQTVDGISNGYNYLSLRFANGVIDSVSDMWTRYDIPEPQLNISEEKAMNRVKENGAQYAADKGYPENKLLYDKAYATLSLQPRENDKLYPQWEVFLPLQKTPPRPIPVSPDSPNYEWHKFYHDAAVSFYNSNHTNGIHVTMWADTGEIALVYTDVASETQPSDDLPTIILTDTNNEEPAETTNPTMTQEPTASPTPDLSPILSPSATVPEFPGWTIPVLFAALVVFVVVRRRLKT